METARSRIEVLRDQLSRELPRMVADVEAEWDAFLALSWSEPVCRQIRRRVHTLAGTAGTFGFGALCAAARHAEGLLDECLEACRHLEGRRGEAARRAREAMREQAGWLA